MTGTETKRERRVAAREERKQRAAKARQQAQIRRIVLVVVALLVVGILGFYAVTTSFLGLATTPIGQTMPLEKADHVAEGTQIAYGTRPPTSGLHYPTWHTSYGVVEQPVPAGFWVHNLEHGAIVLLYNCPEGCPDLVTQLKELHASLPKGRNARRGVARMLITPYTDMDHKVAVVAWGRLLEMDDLDRDKILKFYEAYVDRGPECQNLNCPD
jgi:hypothetical protein